MGVYRVIGGWGLATTKSPGAGTNRVHGIAVSGAIDNMNVYHYVLTSVNTNIL